MNERDKIIETLRASGYGYFVTHEKADADEALNDAADALFANGIGDVEYFKNSYNRKKLECINFIKEFGEHIKHLTKERDEWKKRAEVAEINDKIKERALRKMCKKEAKNGCPFGDKPEKCAKCMQTEELLGCTENAAQCYYEKAIKKAKREIEEEERK